ncbi:MAG TPA: lamin tail domain-containing protein, partial [Candidatus Limnocylindria bacterium]|nr:lamin tail domain-containing protein [Candidatus Limnocylindria bacterium]
MRSLLVLFTVVALGVFLPRNHASVVISEFVAENDGLLHDQDDDSPDWIELFNNSLATVNLGGWHLTDTPTNLTKWTFPPTNFSAGGFLVVFASGKNRTNGAELHMNFQLQNDGGYLALVDLNGVVVSEFNYPQQHRNISFGIGSSNAPATTLLAAGVAARWLVPVNNALGASWTTTLFDASSWSNAVTPLSYNSGTTAGTPILNVDFNTRTGGEAGAANTEAGFSTMTLNANPSTFGSVSLQLSSLGAGVLDDRDRATPVQGGLLTLDQIYDDFIFVNGQVNGDGARLQITGLALNADYQLTIWSFDDDSNGQRVSDWIETASGVTHIITNGYIFDGTVPPARDTDSTFGGPVHSSVAGVLTIEGRRNGGTSHGVFLNALQLAPLTSSSVSGNLAPMFETNASVYARVPFNVANPAAFNSLSLRVKYNDGFVAYLNGTEIARRNAPETLDWTSPATAAHASVLSEDIFLPAAATLLVAGNNVLAVHGLNLHVTNSDFFLEPQLLATFATTITNRFFSPATPSFRNELGYLDVVADTKFSVDRGFYETPFSLSITCATAGAEIRFTTNGSPPSLTNGFVFSSPINITGHSFIRAQAFVPGWVPSGIDTHTYVFLRDVLRQSNNIPGYPAVWAQGSYPADYEMDPNIVNHPFYGATLSNDLRSIPVLSIVTEHDGLWGASRGIYTHATST